MPEYTYRALDKQGKPKTGKIQASNEAGVRSTLTRLELRPIQIKKVGGGGDIMAFLNKGAKVKSKDLVVFTRQLATMVNAGVPLVRSLATMQKQTENPALKKKLVLIAKDVESGLAFADALEKHKDVFNPIYVNMVRAGEAGGILDDILNKLALQQEKDAKIRGKFKSAMTYPTVLITITLVVFIVLMTFVVPNIGTIIADVGDGELPSTTKAMLAISDFLRNYWYIHIGLFGLFVVGIARSLRTAKGRAARDRLLLKTPVLKVVIAKVAVARFSRIFASLMGAGVSVIEAIEVTGKAVGNAVIRDELAEAAKLVANGEQLSEPLSRSQVFPPIVSQMLAIGEETGQIDTVLVKVADFYEEEVDAAVDGLSSILEPILIVVMGGMVGLIAASVLGPISNLSSQI